MTKTTAPEPTDAATARPRRTDWSRVSRWLAPVLLVIASLAVGVVHVPQHDALSPIDEYVYVDYYSKVFEQGVVRYGEEVGDEARRELGCRGVRILLPLADDRCTDSRAILDDDSRFPMGGLTSADIYTPVYFAVTRTLAQPLLWIGITDSPTQAGRMVGVVWLSAAALALFFVLRRFSLPPWAAGGITLLLVGSLPAYWYDTYLSTDAPTLLAGAGMLLLAVRYVQGAGSGWWLVPASAVAIWLKFQNLAVIGAIALGLLLWSVTEAVRADRPRVRAFLRDRRAQVAFAMVGAAILAQGVWLVIRALISLGVESDQGTATPLTSDVLIGLLFRFLTAAGQGVGGPVGTAIVVFGIAQLVSMVGVVGLAAVARPGRPAASFAYGTLIMAVILGPLLAVTIRLTTGEYFAIPERYGLSLYPLFIACAALLVRRRRGSTAVLAALGLVSFVCSLLIVE